MKSQLPSFRSRERQRAEAPTFRSLALAATRTGKAACLKFLLSCLFVPFVVLPAVAATDTGAIARAICDLGAPDHKTREAATRYLSTAGKAAVAALEQAAQSPDPEIRLRAAALLPAARLGIPTDFPADLKEDLIQFAKSPLARKQQTVVRLAEMGRVARDILIELAATEPDMESRFLIFSDVLEPVLLVVSDRLTNGKLDGDTAARIIEGVDLFHSIIPEDSELTTHVVQRLDALGHKQAATDLFERAFHRLEKHARAKPADAERQNNLAWLCAVARRRLDDGLHHISLALKEAPNVPAYLDTQAELYFQKGNPQRALELIEQALARDPEMDYLRKQRDRIKAGDPAAPIPDHVAQFLK